jgi:hypothetical protein
MDKVEKKIVQIVNFPDFFNVECLYRVFIELSDALKIDHGWEVKTINKREDLEDNGIILVSHTNHSINSKEYFENTLSRFEKAIFIGWHWKTHFPFHHLFKKVIYTTEDIHNPLQCYLKDYEYLWSISNYTPLLLRANEPIETIGLNKRKDERIYCYMGSPYRLDMIPTKYEGIYHNACANGFLDYDTRKKIYLTSIIALGFHFDSAIEQQSISQRIFEGMVYGCVVLTNSLFAEKYTDGICVYVKDKKDLEDKIQYYLDNPDKRKEKQEQGYIWTKKKGTNRHSWNNFFKIIEKIF